MNINLETESIKLLTRVMRQYLNFCHSTIGEVKNSEQLSVSGFAGLEKAQLSIYHINRASNMLESLLGFDRSIEELSFQSFDVIQMMDLMCKTLTNLLSASLDFSIECTYSLKYEPSSIMVDQSRLELIIFNILYYCLNATRQLPHHHIHIDMHVQENNDNFAISVTHTNAPPLKTPAEQLVFEKKHIYPNPEHHAFLLNFGTVSLFLAKRLAVQTNYDLSYVRIKNSNKYTVTIPKNIPLSVTNNITEYETNTTILMQCFADILLHLHQE